MNDDFLHSTQALVLQLDKEGRFIAVSPSCSRLGYSEHDLLQKRYLDWVQTTEKQFSYAQLSQLPKHSSISFANHFRHAQGHYVPIIWQMDWRPAQSCICAVGILSDACSPPVNISTSCVAAGQGLWNDAKLLATLFDNAEMGIALVDENQNFLCVNTLFAELFGYDSKELVAENLLRLFPSYKQAQVQQVIQDFIQNHQDFPYDWNMQQKSGDLFDVELRASLVHWQDQTFIMLMASDITMLKQTLRKLQESESRLQLAIANLPIMVDALDEDGYFVLWNRECERITGYSAEDMLDNPDALSYLYPDPEYRDKVSHALRSVLDSAPGRRRGEWQVRCKDGSDKIIAWSVNSAIHIPGFAVWGIGEDVTEREHALRQLRANEERLRLLVENMPVMLMAFDAQGHVIMWNDQCEKITGYSHDKILNNPRALDMLYPQFEYSFYRENPLHRSTGKAWEMEMFCQDGSRKIIAWQDASKRMQISGWARWLIGEDVTARKQTHDIMEENQALLSAVMNHLESGVCISDSHRQIVYVNPACANMHGYRLDALREQDLAVLMTNKNPSFVYRHYYSFLNGAHGDTHEEKHLIQQRMAGTLHTHLSVYRIAQSHRQTYVVWLFHKL